MQTIRTFLSAASPAAIWTDALNDRIGEPPVLPLGGVVDLEICLFAHRVGGGVATLPISDITAATWALKITDAPGGAEYVTASAPVPGICYECDPPLTMLSTQIAVTSDALLADIAGRERVELTGELSGVVNGQTVYVWRLPHIVIFNRL